MKRLFRILMALIFALAALPLQTVLYAPQVAEAATTTFAIIGDYGMDDANEAAVATMVNGWNPDYIIATGDDYYTPAGGPNLYHESTGQYYCNFLKDVAGVTPCATGNAAVNKFFAVPGNHDYTDTGNAGALPASTPTTSPFPGPASLRPAPRKRTVL